MTSATFWSRKIFDRDLANMAAKAGAHVLAKTAARDVLCD